MPEFATPVYDGLKGKKSPPNFQASPNKEKGKAIPRVKSGKRINRKLVAQFNQSTDAAAAAANSTGSAMTNVTTLQQTGGQVSRWHSKPVSTIISRTSPNQSAQTSNMRSLSNIKRRSNAAVSLD